MFNLFSVGLLLTMSVSISVVRSILQTEVSDEEYAVYSALINETYLREPDKSIVIINMTEGNPLGGSEPDKDDISRRLPSISPMTIDDYEVKNKEPRRLKNLSQLKTDYVLLSEEDRFQLFIGQFAEGWERFQKKYPEAAGLIRLSRVGFSPEKSQALVYVDHYCGVTCGAASYVLLKREGDGWKVEKVSKVWVS